MGNLFTKIDKEFSRFRKRAFPSKVQGHDAELLQYKLDNLPYELYDSIRSNRLILEIPVIKDATETTRRILQDRCSLARFGDGEFSIMKGGHIHFQSNSSPLADKLREVMASELPDLLIGLPDCFGSLEHFTPLVAEFWRKWMARKRVPTYACLDMNRTYYSAFFSRAFMPYHKTAEHYRHCHEYFETVKRIWAGRDVVICEGEGTRFGLFNDLLGGARSVSRILCPATDAFDRYPRILAAFDHIGTDRLVLAALGPTATVLAYDLCRRGFQVLDIGHLDIEYEWYLRKDEAGRPIEFKYVDGSRKGRQVHQIKSPEYEAQIIGKIL